MDGTVGALALLAPWTRVVLAMSTAETPPFPQQAAQTRRAAREVRLTTHHRPCNDSRNVQREPGFSHCLCLGRLTCIEKVQLATDLREDIAA